MSDILYFTKQTGKTIVIGDTSYATFYRYHDNTDTSAQCGCPIQFYSSPILNARVQEQGGYSELSVPTTCCSSPPTGCPTIKCTNGCTYLLSNAIPYFAVCGTATRHCCNVTCCVYDYTCYTNLKVCTILCVPNKTISFPSTSSTLSSVPIARCCNLIVRMGNDDGYTIMGCFSCDTGTCQGTTVPIRYHCCIGLSDVCICNDSSTEIFLSILCNWSWLPIHCPVTNHIRLPNSGSFYCTTALYDIGWC